MGAVLSDLFVDPEALPGGKCFSPSCPQFFRVDPDTGANVTDCTFPVQNVTSWEWWTAEGQDHPGLYADCEDQKWFGLVQCLFLAAVYGMILSWASDLISEGSEMLLLVPAYRGIVGSVVLPVLGAVPDGAMILFSGLGSNAKEQIIVGVGALAGSTIMLITVPWFIALLAGKVPLAHFHGKTKAMYSKKSQEVVRRHNTESPPKTILPPWLFTHGVRTNEDTRTSGKIMLATAMLYLIIQIPAFFAFGSLEHGKFDKSTDEVVKTEHPWFIVGFVACFVAFVAYLVYCVKTAQDNENAMNKLDLAINEAIAFGKITMSGAFFQDLIVHRRLSTNNFDSEDMALIGPDQMIQRANDRLDRFLKVKFQRYDADESGTIDASEFKILFKDLGDTESDVQAFYHKMDTDEDGSISLAEFQDHMRTYILGRARKEASRRASVAINDESELTYDDIVNDDDDGASDDENEEEENETGLDPDTQQWEIKKKAFKMMGLGTIVVLLVSDPAVDVLSSLGNRTGISAFYVAFVLAPLASNASELVAAYNYASKKTPSSIGVSLATLEGAGIMNNTFGLGIFFFVIFINNDIAWTFTAETLGIVFVEIAVSIYAQKETMSVFDGCCVLAMYPLSLVLIILLEMYTPLN